LARSTPRPAWPLAQPAHQPRHPRRPKSPDRPIQPARRSRLRGKYIFLFGSRLPEPAASPHFSDNRAPLVSSVFPTVPADLDREPSAPPLPALPAPRLGCRQAFTAPSSFPSLIPFKPSLNDLNGYSSPPLLRPPGALPWPYKSHLDDPRSTPHLTEPFSSPLPRWNPSPPSSRDLFAPPPSPGRHTATRAPVRPEPRSPCLPLRFAPPPVSFGAPERPEAELR
jgi:hypothetical protein